MTARTAELSADTVDAGRLPDFLVIGATKAGTTSLHRWLSGHPDIFVSPHKEMRFFLPGHRWEKGLDWYRAQFAEADGRRTGEFSNGYGRGHEHAGVPGRVRAILPDVRLVYLIRHPIDRLVSHYRHRLVTGRDWRAPDAAIAADASYVQTGCYGAELERWHAVFPAERILVIRSEHLFAQPSRELARLTAHLGVAKHTAPLAAENRANARRRMPAPLRRLIGTTAAFSSGRRLGRALQRLPGLPLVSETPVVLSDATRARLREIYEADRAILRRHVRPDQCDWSLE